MSEDSCGSIPLFCAIEAGNNNVCRELLGGKAEQQVLHVLGGGVPAAGGEAQAVFGARVPADQHGLGAVDAAAPAVEVGGISSAFFRA